MELSSDSLHHPFLAPLHCKVAANLISLEKLLFHSTETLGLLVFTESIRAQHVERCSIAYLYLLIYYSLKKKKKVLLKVRKTKNMKTEHKEVAPQDLFVHGGLRPVQLQLSTQMGCFASGDAGSSGCGLYSHARLTAFLVLSLSN